MESNPIDWAIRHLRTAIDIVENEVRVGDNDVASRLREIALGNIEGGYALLFEIDQALQKEGFMPAGHMVEAVTKEEEYLPAPQDWRDWQ